MLIRQFHSSLHFLRGFLLIVFVSFSFLSWFLNRDKNHVEWCRAWVQTLTELQKYVRQHHTTGVVWAKSGAPAVPAAPGAPPPPPPSMPIGDVAADGGEDRSALFAQINQGEGITRSEYGINAVAFFPSISSRDFISIFCLLGMERLYIYFSFYVGLKKVTSEMQTHKNPALRTGPAPFKAPSSGQTNSVKPAKPIEKPPVFARDGKKWLVVRFSFN